jgi:putative ABC transport system substrate-binding protein
LRRLGYVEGRNLAVERHSGEGREGNFVNIARNVIRARPDVVITSSNTLVLTFKEITDTPVAAVMSDPVAFGIVKSLSRPGGNITGVSVDAGLEIWGKRLQILREAIPTAKTIGFLTSQIGWSQLQAAENGPMREAAQQLGLSIVGPPLGPLADQNEYRRVLTAMVGVRANALIVSDYAVSVPHRRLIVDFVATTKLPAIYPFREYFEVGGLMSYGSSVAAPYVRIAGYVDRLLRGVTAAEMPIFQETKFDLSINLKVASSLGLTIPTSLLLRADKVIE